MTGDADPVQPGGTEAEALQRLARPLGLVQTRLRALADHGWDVNALHLIALEVRALAGAAVAQHIVGLGHRLHQLQGALDECLRSGAPPEPARGEVLLQHVAALNDFTPDVVPGAADPGLELGAARRLRLPELPEPELDSSGLPALTNIPHFIVPPEGFLPPLEPQQARRQTGGAAAGDAVARTTEPLPAAEPEPETAAPAGAEAEEDLQPLVEGLDEPLAAAGRGAEPAAREEPSPEATDAATDDGEEDLAALFADIEQTVDGPPGPLPESPARARPREADEPATASDHARSLYVLHGGAATTLELVRRLGERYEVQSFTDPAELLEILGALGPDGVLVDDAHLDRIDAVAPIVRKLRAKAHGPLPLIVLSARRDLQTRLRLMRAGADVFVPAEAELDPAVERIREALDSTPEDPYRILIVEDDRSQALFAQSILTRAGMQAHIDTDPLAVIDSLERLEPDLVLMDLHMPDCDGMELTAVIRERERFLNTPIVFLSGEDDEDVQFDALLAGGDDFLTKPIRPRHLISAVKNRVRRARSKPASAGARPAARTGLVDRSVLAGRLARDLEALAGDAAREAGGVLYVEVDRLYALRRRHSLTVLEKLTEQIEPMLTSVLGAEDCLARYGDAAWCLYFPAGDLAGLEGTAKDLVKTVAAQPVELGGETTRISLSAGLALLGPQFENPTLLVAAAERACNRDADEDYGRIGVHRQVLAAGDASLRELGAIILQALDQDAFQMVYQPIVSLQGQEVDHYQCLLRLPREGEEPLAPARVLSAASELGMVDRIDRWVLRSAVGVLAEHADRDRSLQLFVNQSGEADGEGDLAGWLVRMLAERRVPGASLILEFKLHELARSLKSVVALARRLAPRRVRFCLGHFDGSETGFRILEHFRADFVKIRPEVAFRQLRDGLLAETVDRLHQAGARVIVPGVEEAQLAVQLWSSGVDFIQGFFVQRPESDLTYRFDGAGS